MSTSNAKRSLRAQIPSITSLYWSDCTLKWALQAASYGYGLSMLPINNDDEEPQQRLDYAFEMLSFTDPTHLNSTAAVPHVKIRLG